MSRAQQLKPGDVSLGQAYEFWKAFGLSGGTLDMAQKAIEQKSVMQRIVDAIKNDAPKNLEGLSYVHDARQINELLSLGYTDEQLTAFGPPPDSLPGFLTFFDCGWDMLRLRMHCKDKGGIFYQQEWYDGQEFSKKQEEPRYRQIRMEALEGSFYKIFDTQKALLPDTEEIPLARQVVMGMVVHFLRTGQRMFPACYVRCIDKDSDGCRVYVGRFNGESLYVNGRWDDDRCDGLGLAAARKF